MSTWALGEQARDNEREKERTERVYIVRTILGEVERGISYSTATKALVIFLTHHYENDNNFFIS